MDENTLLLVDDERDIRDLLGIYLSDLGYSVLAAANGEEALDLLRRHRPHIVLADIRMPGMDGIELLGRIKTEAPDTEVIMITGQGDLDLAIKSLKRDATDFIVKPIQDDILEIALKRARERIMARARSREHTENLETLVGEIAGLSHTIKTIAGGIEGGAFVLEKGIELGSREYLLEGWEMTRTSVERIKNLALDVLKFAKSETVKRHPCDPNLPAVQAVETMGMKARQAGIDLVLERAPDAGPVLLDPDAMHRCLLDLVANAMDAVMGRSEDLPAKKRVTIKVLRSDAPGIEYRVIDNGCGMAPEVKEKIFRGFFSTKGPAGTGIGLMLVRRIVDGHQGTISVESEAGAGTTVRIRLTDRS